MNLDRMYTQLEEKMETQLGYRGDLYSADYRIVNGSIAKFLMGYNTSLGLPTLSDVASFVIKNFSGRIAPKLETARIYPDDGALSLIVGKVRPTRPYSDRTKMLAVAATLFMDEDLGDKWEVERNGDRVFLTRIDQEDIGGILAQQMKNMQVQSSTLTFASLQDAKCVANAQAGDTVKFFKDNQVMEGVLVSMGPAKATIRKGGESFVIDPVAIFEVLKVGRSTKQDVVNSLMEYYKKAYPRDYGKMFINLFEKQ